MKVKFNDKIIKVIIIFSLFSVFDVFSLCVNDLEMYFIVVYDKLC